MLRVPFLDSRRKKRDKIGLAGNIVIGAFKSSRVWSKIHLAKLIKLCLCRMG